MVISVYGLHSSGWDTNVVRWSVVILVSLEGHYTVIL